MVQQASEFLLLFLLLAVLSKGVSLRQHQSTNEPPTRPINIDEIFCLSWRLAVETNNVLQWRTVPTQCLEYVEDYLIHGQYERDLELIVGQALSYVNGIPLIGDGMDAWILDVDETCISNIFYYKGKKYGCDPYDPLAFKAWAMKGWCTGIPPVLRLFNKLTETGFKVVLLTGRDKDTLGEITMDNLHNQGFIGYERLIMRTSAYKGQSAVTFKSDIRKQLEDQDYRIWGNMGDQWSDLQGNSCGNRTFKLPNPMYFVP